MAVHREVETGGPLDDARLKAQRSQVDPLMRATVRQWRRPWSWPGRREPGEGAREWYRRGLQEAADEGARPATDDDLRAALAQVEARLARDTGPSLIRDADLRLAAALRQELEP